MLRIVNSLGSAFGLFLYVRRLQCAIARQRKAWGAASVASKPQDRETNKM